MKGAETKAKTSLKEKTETNGEHSKPVKSRLTTKASNVTATAAARTLTKGTGRGVSASTIVRTGLGNPKETEDEAAKAKLKKSKTTIKTNEQPSYMRATKASSASKNKKEDEKSSPANSRRSPLSKIPARPAVVKSKTITDKKLVVKSKTTVAVTKKGKNDLLSPKKAKSKTTSGSKSSTSTESIASPIQPSLATPELSPRTPVGGEEEEEDILKSEVVHDDDDLGLQDTEDDTHEEEGSLKPRNMFMQESEEGVDEPTEEEKEEEKGEVDGENADVSAEVTETAIVEEAKEAVVDEIAEIQKEEAVLVEVEHIEKEYAEVKMEEEEEQSKEEGGEVEKDDIAIFAHSTAIEEQAIWEEVEGIKEAEVVIGEDPVESIIPMTTDESVKNAEADTSSENQDYPSVTGEGLEEKSLNEEPIQDKSAEAVEKAEKFEEPEIVNIDVPPMETPIETNIEENNDMPDDNSSSSNDIDSANTYYRQSPPKDDTKLSAYISINEGINPTEPDNLNKEQEINNCRAPLENEDPESIAEVQGKAAGEVAASELSAVSTLVTDVFTGLEVSSD